MDIKVAGIAPSPHAAPQQSAHQGGVLQAAGAEAGPAAGDTPQAQQGDWTRKLKKLKHAKEMIESLKAAAKKPKKDKMAD